MTSTDEIRTTLGNFAISDFRFTSPGTEPYWIKIVLKNWVYSVMKQTYFYLLGKR